MQQTFSGERLRQRGRIPSMPAAHVLGPELVEGIAESSSLLTSFSDQAGNINGVLFQASLPAYLVFLYFLNYEKNNTPPLVCFGFAFLLAFVLLTIPSGIISKSSFSVILADSDWLHGSAESLLTCTNILIVLGFRGALTGNEELASGNSGTARSVALGWFVTVVCTLALGVPLGFQAHTPFLAGLGALEGFSEPVNALSIPTWIVHWSTVFEFLIAMSLAWSYADAVGNPKWKGLTWGMFPSSVSHSRVQQTACKLWLCWKLARLSFWRPLSLKWSSEHRSSTLKRLRTPTPRLSPAEMRRCSRKKKGRCQGLEAVKGRGATDRGELLWDGPRGSVVRGAAGVLSVKKQMHFFDGARAHEVRSRWFYPKNGFVNRRAELPERRVSLAQADLSTCPVSQAELASRKSCCFSTKRVHRGPTVRDRSRWNPYRSDGSSRFRDDGGDERRSSRSRRERSPCTARSRRSSR
eukprot:g23846.t1